jgi:hypothetical protein
MTLFLIYSFAGNCYYEKIDNSGKLAEMNGIKFKDFSNFSSQWKLVTVRYRADSKEIRMVYANNLAWAGLKKLKPSYQDGAAFGKVAFLTESDPVFISSLMPSGVKRFQVMVKNSKKYGRTDGWGYALFTSEGGLFKEDMKSKVFACVACHRVVPERDFIFSRPVQVGLAAPDFIKIRANKKNMVNFLLSSYSHLSNNLKKEMKNEKKDIFLIDGDLKKYAFSGTLDEIVPALIEKTKLTGRAASLFLNNENFSLVEKINEKCINSQEVRFHVVIKFNNGLVRNNEFCQ